MNHPMHTTSVPVFKQILQSLDAILIKAEEHANAKKIEASVFLQARLAPDMFPLIRQVQIAADFAKGVSARLAGVEVPEFEGVDENTPRVVYMYQQATVIFAAE